MFNRLFRLIPVAVAAVLLAVAMAACSGPAVADQEQAVAPPSDVPMPVYKAGFYLNVGDIQDNSRAPADGEYNPGSGIDNFIDISDPATRKLRILLYDNSDNFLGELTDLVVSPIEDYESSKRYHVEGITTVNISSGKFKVMVLANWPSYPVSLTMDAIFASSFDFDGSLPSRNNPIPLYGISDVDLGRVSPGVSVNIGTIHLIRALAKIEVTFSDPADMWHLSSIVLTHYNTRGLRAPAVRSRSEYIKGTWTADYTGRVFLPADPGTANDLPLYEIETGRRWIIYVPEYANTLNTSPLTRLCLEFAENSAGKRYVELRDPAVSATGQTDIVRNVWYKIAVKKLPEDADLTVTVDALPYASADLNPEFGLDRDDNGNIVTPPNND